MKLFIKHAVMRHNLFRAIKVGLVVGTILGIINHYDIFITGNIESVVIIQIILTYFVPFSVSLHGGAMYGRHIEILSKEKKSN